MSMYLHGHARRIHDAIVKGLMDKKMLIKGGWALDRAQCVPHDAGEAQVRETRIAFYAGAQHVLASIMAGMDPGSEVTADDDLRMQYIEQELEEFATQFAAQVAPAPKGRG